MIPDSLIRLGLRNRLVGRQAHKPQRLLREWLRDRWIARYPDGGPQLALALTSDVVILVDPQTDPFLAGKFLRQGDYERGFGVMMRAMLRPGDTLFDVGGCYGHIGLAAARAQPSARVFIVEANPAMYRRIRTHIEMNGLTNVTPIGTAVGRCRGVAGIVVDSNNLGATRIVPDGDDRTGDVVPVATLDELVHEHGSSEIAFVKLDIEGSERDAIAGGEQLLDGKFGTPPIVAAESSPHQGDPASVRAHFRDRGWSIFVLDGGKEWGRRLRPLTDSEAPPPHDNLFFVPPSRLDRVAGLLAPQAAGRKS